MGVFSGTSDVGEFVANVDRVYSVRARRSGFPPLRVYMLKSRISPGELDTIEKIDDKFSARIEAQNDNLTEFTVRRRWGDDKEEETAYVIGDHDSWVIVYAGQRAVLIEGLLYRLEPLVTPSRIISHDFLRLTGQMTKEVKALAIRQAFLGMAGQSLLVKRNVTVDYLTYLVDKEHRWVQTLTYHCVENDTGQRSFSLSLERNGAMKMYDGCLSLVIKVLVEPLWRLTDSNFRFWSGKESMKQLDKTVEPVRIRFRKEFNKERIHSIVEAMESVESMRYAIAHEGNPYFMAHVLDSVDGSSMDLFACGKDIYMVPTQRVTPNSYMKVVEALFSRLNEGRIVGLGGEDHIVAR
jgi:hypothetical protein